MNSEYKSLIEMGVFFAALLAVLIPFQMVQTSRTDKLYEMFIELLKNQKKGK